MYAPAMYAPAMCAPAMCVPWQIYHEEHFSCVYCAKSLYGYTPITSNLHGAPYNEVLLHATSWGAPCSHACAGVLGVRGPPDAQPCVLASSYTGSCAKKSPCSGMCEPAR